MDSSTNKRRKLGHGGTGPAFKHGSAPTSASGAFAEATQELLDEIRVDYDQFRDGVKQTLQQFVETIGNIQPHEPELVRSALSILA